MSYLKHHYGYYYPCVLFGKMELLIKTNLLHNNLPHKGLAAPSPGM